jgi:hypothetical protein
MSRSRKGILVPPILSMMTPEGTPRDSNDPISPPGTLLSVSLIIAVTNWYPCLTNNPLLLIEPIG